MEKLCGFQEQAENLPVCTGLSFLYLFLPHPGLWGGAVHMKSGFQVSFLCQCFLETPHGHIQMWPTE